ncbi:MAG TPA: hypothetical protein VEK57_20915 [Thermoanaerobaculia bacterium]|nr:hypothetical protein [Thermoanaerobaculia bacterium]
MATTRSSKKRSSGSKGGAAGILNNVTGSATVDPLIGLVEGLGLVDVLLGRVKSRIEETDLDELMEEVTDYMRRNPEVLVVSLGAVTVATGLLVWLNNRREWDGAERRAPVVTSSPGRVRRTTRVAEESDDEEE